MAAETQFPPIHRETMTNPTTQFSKTNPIPEPPPSCQPHHHPHGGKRTQSPPQREIPRTGTGCRTPTMRNEPNFVPLAAPFCETNPIPARFDLGISNFELVSGFGIRISDFPLSVVEYYTKRTQSATPTTKKSETNPILRTPKNTKRTQFPPWSQISDFFQISRGVFHETNPIPVRARHAVPTLRETNPISTRPTANSGIRLWRAKSQHPKNAKRTQFPPTAGLSPAFPPRITRNEPNLNIKKKT